MEDYMKDDTKLINEVLERIPNKYLAVVVASERAKAVNDGTVRPQVKTSAAKPTTIALEEIAAGLVVPGPARPEIEAKEDEKKPAIPSPDSPMEEEE
jgi:DNA-directed RNA polymerase omega subunit